MWDSLTGCLVIVYKCFGYLNLDNENYKSLSNLYYQVKKNKLYVTI